MTQARARAMAERRTGPRPLPLHLTIATGYYLSSIAASGGLRSGSTPWTAALAPRAAALREAVRTHRPPASPPERNPGPRRHPPRNPPPRSPDPSDPGPSGPAAGAAEAHVWAAFTAAVDRAARGELAAMLDGIESYRHHAYERALADPPPLWTEGTTRLIDYRGLRDGPARGAALLVPSLINRGYVLDLSEEASLARWLARQGFDVFLVDWDAPGEVERGFDLAAYVARLTRAVAVAAEAAGRPVGLVGYCMGGLLTLPLAAGVAGPAPPVDRMALLATPWDFHAERAAQARALGALTGPLEPMLALAGELPTDVVQALFAGLDPFLALNKFARFARLDPDSAKARAFVALEDWLNDGVPLAAPVARECLAGWYGANRPGTGAWALDGWRVDPAAVAVPTLALIPAGDRIVPPGSAAALADAIPGCRVERPSAGHIGMVVGGRAERQVWRPLADFLAGGAPAS